MIENDLTKLLGLIAFKIIVKFLSLIIEVVAEKKME